MLNNNNNNNVTYNFGQIKIQICIMIVTKAEDKLVPSKRVYPCMKLLFCYTCCIHVILDASGYGYE